MRWLQLDTKSVFEGTYTTRSSSIIAKMFVDSLSLLWTIGPLAA